TTASTLATALEHSAVAAPVQVVLRRLLSTLDQEVADDEEFRPALVRRLIEHGWLDDLLGKLPELAPLREALREATTLQVVQRWSSDDTVLEDLRDAFGR